jgi:hypothetical protein
MSEDINKAIDFIFTEGKKQGQAKAEVTYLTEFLKSKKAILTKDALVKGAKSVAAAELEALSNPDYIGLLDGLKEATEKAESIKWSLVSAQARIDCWRSLEASNRRMDRVAM